MKQKSISVATALLALGIAFSVWGDSTGLGISNSFVTLIDNTTGTLDFPIARTGDTSFDAFIQFQTQDGTAVAGVNYTATGGSIVIPAGITNATISVPVQGSGSGGPDVTFQMLVFGGGGGTFTPSFATSQPFGAGTSPLSVKAADLNGDGLLDLIVSDAGGSAVSVLRNTTAPGASTPSFATKQTFPTGNIGDSVAVADVNGDGKPDLIVVNQGDNTVSVLLNTTSPGAITFSFATQHTFATGAAPEAIATADFNGDGKPDLIVGNGNDETISVLLNTTATGAATPSFATQQTFAIGEQVGTVTVADLNGDGRPDVIAANEFDNNVSVLLNTTAPGASTPSFATQQTFATGNAPFTVVTADLNGDGLPDLIVSNKDDKTVSVLLNTTTPGAVTPTFSGQQTFATGTQPFGVTAADVNGDGKPDLVVANTGDRTISVMLNVTAPGAPSASFTTQQTFSVGKQPFAVTAADLNGDGKLDVITANDADATISVLFNTTAPPATTFDGNSFAAHDDFTTGSGPESVTSADVNGDGRPDLIVANFNDDTVSVLLNANTPGDTTPSFATQHSFGTGSGAESVTAADLNGDGRPDLIVTNVLSNTVSVLLDTTAPGATTPSFAPQQTFGTGTQPFSVTAADVNGDGLLDLIVANSSDPTVSVLLNTTAPGATTPSFAAQHTFTTGGDSTSVATADINGDGRPDLIAVNDGGVSVLLNTTAPGASTPSFATQQTFGTGAAPTSVTVADINGDGLPDLIVANQNDDTVSVLLNTTAPGATTPSFATQQTFATGSLPLWVTAADVNGDGLSDLIVANDGDDTVSVLLNTTAPGATTPSFATQQTFAVNSEPVAVAVADVNGDGMPDLIAANASSNKVSVLLNAQYAATVSGSPATGTIHYTPPPPPPTKIFVPAALAMGKFPVANTVIKNLTVKNTGINPLFVGDVTSNNPEFAATGSTTCPSGGLAPGLSCSIAIGFTPSALGLRSATISVNDNTATSPQHVPANGTGTADMTVTPTSSAFGNVKIGAKSNKTITVHNFQTIPVSLTLPPGFSGTNLTDFTMTGGTCTSSVPATSTCTLVVTYAPTAIGAESATMTVTDGPDTLGPYTVSFTASASVPESLSTANLNFAKVAKTASKTLSVTVTNNAAGAPITLTGTSIGGTNAGDFAVTGGTCTGTLAASSSCTYSVTFTPSTETAESGALSIGVAEDPGSPRSVSLNGIGASPLAATPLTGIAFGTIAGGHSSLNKTVTVINNGAVTLTISESISGANPTDFAVTGGTCGATITGGGTHCTYLVKFTPSIVGAESATIGVSAVGDAASPHNVSLSGTGS